MSRERKTIKMRNFNAAHNAADRFDDPIGVELGRLDEELRLLILEYGEHGDLSALYLHQIAGHIERLGMFEKIKTVQAELRERAEALGGLVASLGADRKPGAVERVRLDGIQILAGVMELDAFDEEA